MRARRIWLGALLLVLCLVLAGCATDHVALSRTFLEAMERGEGEALYDLFWQGGETPSKEEFLAARDKFLRETETQSVTLSRCEAVQEGKAWFLDFTAVYHTRRAGDVENSCRLRMIEGETLCLQYKPDFFLEDYDTTDSIVYSVLDAPRGEIFSADGDLLAANDWADTVYVKVPEVQEPETVLAAIERTLPLTDKERERVRKDWQVALERDYGTVIVRACPKDSLTAEQKDSLTSVAGVYIDDKSMTPLRYYPQGTLYAHVTGYASAPSAEQAETLAAQGLSAAGVTGQTGLELARNAQLTGKDGFRLSLWSREGSLKKIVAEQPAQAGVDVWTTVDSGLQERLYYAMATQLTGEETGAALVVNTATGGVEAQVSWPSFDTNAFVTGISEEEYQQLIAEDGGQPLFSRVTQGLYPPGSLIKPFSVTPALQAGIVDEGSVFPHALTANEWYPPENWPWEPIRRNEFTQNPLTLYEAMRLSDNIYFAWAALELGAEDFTAYMQRIGFGGPAPAYDLPVAGSNLLNEDTEMDRKLLADTSFGHGQMLSTPLQMASLYTAFTNDGDALSPYLVECTKAMEGDAYVVREQASRQVYVEDVFDEQTLDTLLTAMEGVTAPGGTGASLTVKDRTIYAKTGTALKGEDKNREVSWVAAWEPARDKLVLVMIDLDRHSGGSAKKLAIAREMIRNWGEE